MKHVLITDFVHNHLIDGLERLGFKVIYEPEINVDGLDKHLPQLAGIVINSKIKMTRQRIEKAKKLKFIARLGSGLEIIDLDSASDKGVFVYNSPEGNRNAVAEHAIGMLLSLQNNLLKSDGEVRKKLWYREENRGIELEGKTIGIVGMGNTGRTLASKLSCWGLKILYYDPYVSILPEEYKYLEKTELRELQAQSDIISLHVQLTPETNQMVDGSFLSQCKKNLILINTSRGPVVNTESLVFALQNSLISGACLDVFENEKPDRFSEQEQGLYAQLYKMQNVILSPHIAGWTQESLFKIADVLLNKISKHI